MTSQLLVSALVLGIGVHVILIVVAYLVFLERKISSYIQDRIGPNRVGFDFGLPFLSFLSTKGPLKGVLGLGQPLADGIKFLVKEDYAPTKADKALFTLAPMLIIGPALIGFVIIPWGGYWDMPYIGDIPLLGGLIESLAGPLGDERVLIAGANVNVGIVYLLAVASLGVYGVTLGGWASNSKYSFLGGLRATAQMISYEIPLGLSLIAVLLLTGTVLPQAIVEYQVTNGWLVIAQPVACVLFFIAILAEANRAPFDNAEAEQELVGGYHTEYSSMRFALFFLAEYAHMVTSSAFWVLLFFGGYHFDLSGIPLIGEPLFGWLGNLTDPATTGIFAVLTKCLIFLGKVVFIICFQMVIRWTLPRLRYDQIMMLGWQTLIPLSLTVVVLTSVGVYFGLAPHANDMGVLRFVPMLAMNVVVIVGFVAFQTVFPSSTKNRRIRMYGSRFFAPDDAMVETTPSNPMALEDRPHQGTEQVVAG
ncbi:MAG: hydroxyacid dehydrogenase [Phycisphaerae bacterium]|nr:hydroxyacid dehydrogenase [Phycisphaerae bacterium]